MAKFEKVNFEKSTPTTAKNLARSAMVDFVKTVMIETFGEDNVSVVGASEISIAIGDRKDSDGFIREVCVNIAPVAKEVEDRATTKNVFEAYDRLQEAENYATTIKDKEKEKAEKEAAKKKAKEKLEAAKAKKEAERKKRVAEKLSAKSVDKTDEDSEEVKTVDESTDVESVESVETNESIGKNIISKMVSIYTENDKTIDESENDEEE